MEAQFMQMAVALAGEKMRGNAGGPFGAVVVRRGKIIARGWNEVTSTNDPTAHAEISAIRAAAKKLKNFRLDDCELYASCEPCPMCLAASYWARIGRIYFAATRQDAARAGFDDALIYREINRPPSRRKISMKPLLRGEALKVFAEWKSKPGKIAY